MRKILAFPWLRISSPRSCVPQDLQAEDSSHFVSNSDLGLLFTLVVLFGL